LVKDFKKYIGVKSLFRCEGKPVLTAWVMSFDEKQVFVRIEGSSSLDRNATYSVEMFGQDTIVQFNVKFGEVFESDFYSLYKRGKFAGSAYIDVDFVDLEFRFQIISEKRFRSNEKGFELLVAGLSATICTDASKEEIEVRSIGYDYMECVLDRRLEIETKHELALMTVGGTSSLSCIVEDIKEVSGCGELYQIVFKIAPKGRLDVARYRALVDQQLLAA
jgi:hypothetical protein